jgi:hypothetical protein
MINNGPASPGSIVTLGEVKASSTILQERPCQITLNDLKSILKTIGEETVGNIVVSKLATAERKDLSVANTTATDVKKLITGGGALISYAQSLAKFAQSGARSLVARVMIALDRLDKLSKEIGLRILIDGANLTAILTTCVKAAARTLDPDTFGVYMAIETVKELFSDASLSISTDTPPTLFDPGRLHGGAADTRDAFLGAAASGVEATQAYQIASILTSAARLPPQPPSVVPIPPSSWNPLPPPSVGLVTANMWSPQVHYMPALQATGLSAGTSATVPPGAPVPSGAPPGATPLPNAPPTSWCWDFNRPGGCKLPPRTCKMNHVIVPCPKLQTPAGCPLSPSACRYRH